MLKIPNRIKEPSEEPSPQEEFSSEEEEEQKDDNQHYKGYLEYKEDPITNGRLKKWPKMQRLNYKKNGKKSDMPDYD